MKKVISIILSLVLLLSLGSSALAEDTTSTDSTGDSTVIELLLAQIEILTAQIEAVQVQIQILRQNKGALKEIKQETKTTLKLIKNLSKGMSGEDVLLLQEFLATDPDIYPEGLTTGYFGNLTEKAVKRFQKKMGVEQVGNVGPKTTSKVNELLEQGVGNSGKVPPGLLIAPGIAKKIGYTPTVSAGQTLPKGIAKKLGLDTGTGTTTDDDNGTTTDDNSTTTDPDIIAPIISTISATTTTTTLATITWATNEEADSVVYYSTSSPVEIATSTDSVSDLSLTLNHEVALSSLNASTTYYYLVSSSDEANNTATSSEQSFVTLTE